MVINWLRLFFLLPVLLSTLLLSSASSWALTIEQVPQSYGKGRIYDVVEDENGITWVATETGLFICDMVNLKMLRITMSDSNGAALYDNSITAVANGPNQTIWVGTVSGLNKINMLDIDYKYLSSVKTISLRCEGRFSTCCDQTQCRQTDANGYELCKALKQDTATSHIPVILLSALGVSENRIEGFEALTDEYLVKPFNQQELKARVESLLVIRTLLQQRFAQSEEKPRQQQSTCMPKKELESIERVKKLIEKNLSGSEFSAKNIHKEMAVSERLLQRKLKALTGQTPAEHIRAMRLKKATELLAEGHYVGQIADMVGFSSQSYFTSCFKARYGVPPREYCEKAR